jgi:hypothetical protein
MKTNNHEVIANQPDKLMKKARESAKEQLKKERQLMAQGWRWVKDAVTRSHKLVPPS